MLADNGVTGMELYSSDGTANGTRLVKDINDSKHSGPSSGISFGDHFYFSADGGSTGRELWKSNGTEAGTVLVKDIAPGVSSSHPGNFLVFKNLLYFVVSLDKGLELWKSDGTEVGTQFVSNLSSSNNASTKIYPVGDNLFYVIYLYGHAPAFGRIDGITNQSVPVSLPTRISVSESELKVTYVNSSLYFSARDREDNLIRYIWRLDATTNSITRVNNTNGEAYSVLLYAVKNDIYFSKGGISGAVELWKISGLDGTVSLVKTFANSTTNRWIQKGAVFVDLFYFFVGTDTGFDLWKSDGTDVGTSLVKGTAISRESMGIVNLTLAATNSKLFFLADKRGTGRDIWVSDGSPTGTTIVASIDEPSSISSYYYAYALTDSVLIFSVDSDEKTKLTRSDGTTQGTHPLKITTNDNLRFGVVFASDVKIYLSLNDVTHGYELWASDGTELGTHLLKDINTSTTAHSMLRPAGRLSNGKTLFSVYRFDDPNKHSLWITDSTGEGTNLVTSFDSPLYGTPTDSRFPYEVSFNNLVYFRVANDKGWYDIWKTDGNETGTTKIFEITSPAYSGQHPIFLSENPGFWGADFVATDDSLFFTIPKESTTTALWTSDGTRTGTHLVSDIDRGKCLGPVVPGRHRIYFCAYDAIHGEELWTSDGTASGTKIVKDLFTGAVSGVPRLLGVVNDELYFYAKSDSGNGLWRSNGTESGTELIKEMEYIDLFSASSGNVFYFTTSNPVEKTESVWRSDGTTSGTKMLKSFRFNSPNRAYIGWLVAGDQTVFFQLVTPDNETQLWWSDGTPIGTRSITKNIFPPLVESLNTFYVRGDILFFVATDAEHGSELWRSDGTVSGTTMVTDLNPGRPSGAFYFMSPSNSLRNHQLHQRLSYDLLCSNCSV